MTLSLSPVVGNITMTLVNPVSFKMPEGRAEYNNFPILPAEDGVTGYIPGTSLRGLIRRSAVLTNASTDAANGQPWSLQRMYAELIGQDTNSEKESDLIDLDEIAETREKSPIIDLFGCGLSIKGRLQVSVLLPTTPTPPVLVSFVRKDLNSDTDVLAALTDQARKDFYDRSGANRQRARFEANLKRVERQLRDHDRSKARMSDEAHGEAMAMQADLTEKLNALRERLLGMENSTLRPLSFWALPPGLVLKGRLVIDRPRERDWKILKTAFNAMSERPMIGGHTARGCGEFKMEIDFRQGGHLIGHFSVGGFEALRSGELLA